MVIQSSRRRAGQLVARAGIVLSSVMIGVTAFGMSTSGVPSASAATNAGAAVVVTPCDGTPGACQPLAAGDSTTPFTLLLPTGAACTGDSTLGGYNVTSFMVPSSVELDTLEFDPVTGPQPGGVGADFRQPLFDVSTSAYTARLTADAPQPGGPGPVPSLPAFFLDQSIGLVAGDIPAGTYEVGIACIKGPPSATQLDNYWVAQLEVAEDPGDPVGIAWTAEADPSATTTTGGAGSTSTTAGGSTTSAPDGSTSTSVDGSTSTSSGATSSTVDGVTTSTAGGLGPSANSFGSSLPRTGSSPVGLVLWSALLLVFGRMAVVLSRPPRLRPAR
jgi:hypothetical protein